MSQSDEVSCIIQCAHAQAIGPSGASPDSQRLPYLYTNSTVLQGQSLWENPSASNFSSFSPWGKSNLTLTQTSSGSVFSINGSTGPEASGFQVTGLNTDVRYVLVHMYNVRQSTGSQLSFEFDLSDGTTTYHLILVNGPLTLAGWHGTTYFAKMTPPSAQQLDLNKIFGTSTLSLKLQDVTINLQKNAQVNAEFSIGIITPENYLRGTLDANSKDFDGYIVHNLGIVRSVQLDFAPTPSNYTVVADGWQEVKTEVVSDPTIGNKLVLTGNEPPSQFDINLLSKIDPYRSITELGTKDWLLLAVTLIGCCILPLRNGL